MRYNTTSHHLTGCINELGLMKYLSRKHPHLTFRLTDNFGDLDCRGVDVVGYDNKTQVYFAQAKSSYWAAVDFGERYCLGQRIHVWYVDDDGEWQEHIA